MHRQTAVGRGTAGAVLLAMVLGGAAAGPRALGQVTFDWATVGDPGNAPDTQVMTKPNGSQPGDGTSGYGSVDHIYRISKYHVTNDQYVAFLNKVDPIATDATLYVTNMSSLTIGGISYPAYAGGIDKNSSAAAGGRYTVKPGQGSYPVVHINWARAARFVNWLANGQGSSGTESGVYDMSVFATNSFAAPPPRAAGAEIFLPSENEWYKAAYYDPTKGGVGGYWQYGTRSDSAPASVAPPGSSNSANIGAGTTGASGGAFAATLAKTGAAFDRDTDYLTSVGSYTTSMSYYGLSDLEGVVFNWTEAARENRTLAGQMLPIYRGGVWQNNELNSGAAFRNTGNGAGVNIGQFQNWGFRIAALPAAPSADIVIDVASGSLTQAQAGYAEIGVADSVIKTGAGTLVFDAVNGYSGPTRIDTGRLSLAAAGSVAASPRVAVGEGATFDVSAKTGGYAVPAGQTLAGSGTVEGSVAIGTAATLSPGASPGTLTVTSNVTLSGGGNYNWQIYDAAGTAGSTTGWDLLSVGGGLDIASTSGSPFNINLWSLSGVGPDVNGSAVNWNSAQNGSWKIASAVGGITGFAADKFAVNTAATNGTAGFTNDPAGGSFAVVQDGNDLVLQFTAGGGPAPEPVRITGVYVKGSGWNADYQARSPFSNVQGATVGWELPDGPAQLANASNVAWNNVNTITVEFDQPIAQPDAAALQLVRGTASGNQTIVPTLDPTLLGDGSVAQWTLPAGFAALERGKYVISIAADGITNIAGTTILDGDWITGVSTFAQGSGNGEAGGSFNFFFNSLVGDVNGDGVMNVSDLSTVRNALTSPLNTQLAADSSNYRLDINGSNSLNSSDLSQTRAQLTSALGTQLSSLPSVTAPAEGVAASGLTVTAVPEPGSLGLLACGLAALLALGVRRQKA